MPDLSDYAGQMLGSQNQTRPDDDVTLVAQVDAMTPSGRRHMRGVPFVAKGVGGTQEGTDPVDELLAKEERGELRW